MGAAASSALVLLSLEGSRASSSDGDATSSDYMYDFSITREAGNTAHDSQHAGGRRLSERPRFTLSAIRRRWAQTSRQLVENTEDVEKSQQCVPPSLADDEREGPENNIDAAAIDLGVLAGTASNSTSCVEGEVCHPSTSSPAGGLCMDDSACPEACPAEVCGCYSKMIMTLTCLKAVTDSCKDGSCVSNCEQAPITPALEESNLAARQGTCDVYTCVLDTCGDTPPRKCYSEASYDCYCKGYAATCKLYNDICSLGVDGSGMTRNQWRNACYYAPTVCNLASCCTCNSGYICIAEPKKAVNCSTVEPDEDSTVTTSSSKHSLSVGAAFVAAVSIAISILTGH